MAPKKPTTTTVTKTITGITELVEHSTDMQLTPMPNNGRPYILESDEFNQFILAKRAAAAREIDGLDHEIRRLQTEIEARFDRRKDLMSIVIRADAALNMQEVNERPAPKMVEKGAA